MGRAEKEKKKEEIVRSQVSGGVQSHDRMCDSLLIDFLRQLQFRRSEHSGRNEQFGFRVVESGAARVKEPQARVDRHEIQKSREILHVQRRLVGATHHAQSFVTNGG